MGVLPSIYIDIYIYIHKNDLLPAASSCKEQEILAVFSQRALNELAPGATLDVFNAAANLSKTSDPEKSLHFRGPP